MKYHSLLALAATAGSLSAQGLLGILPTLEEVQSKPFSYGLGVNLGYDSNINTEEFDETSSTYVGAMLSGDYRFVTDRTVFNLGVSGGGNYYFDQVDPYDQILYSGRFGGNITHAITDRLSIDDVFSISYDYDPNFVTGASTNRQNDEYLWAFNSLNVNYIWTDRLSTQTSFTAGTTIYDNDAIATNEDRVELGVSQMVRYALSEQTGLRAQYRYFVADYDSGIQSTTHTVSAGLDHAFDENTMMVFMAGAQFMDNDLNEGSQSSPYVELGLNRTLTESLSIHWANRLGQETTGIGVYTANQTFRSNLDLKYKVSEKLSSFFGVSYLYTDYDGDPGNTEQLLEGRAGLNYAITEVLGLGLSYTYTTLDSDEVGQSYDRQRVNLGLNASF